MCSYWRKNKHMLTGLHCSRSLLMMLFRAKGAGKEGRITHGKQKENLEKYKQTWIRGGSIIMPGG